MTRFIVHIGDGKCGSSAIQASLYEERARLRGMGIGYESHSPTAGNYCLVTLMGQETRGNDAEQRDLAEKQIEALAAKAADCDHIVLSNEALLQLGPDALPDVLSRISPDIERIDVVAYVRDPSSMYLSILQQTLKASYTYSAPDDYSRPIDEWLQNWRSHPAIDSVTVRLFDRGEMVGASAIADFAQVFGAITGMSDFSLPEQDQNTSLCAEQMIILQEFRHRFCHRHNKKNTPESVRLVRFFENLNRAGLPGTKPALVADANTEIRSRHAEMVRVLMDDYGVRLKATPTPDPPARAPEERNWTSVSNLLEDFSADMIARLKLFIPHFNPAILDASDTTMHAMATDFARYCAAEDGAIEQVLKGYRKQEAKVRKG